MVAALSQAKNESPGAAATAPGAGQHSIIFRTKYYRDRADAATSLALAIAECDPADACELMAAALADLSIDMPQPPLFSIMDQAAWWADMASQSELKAYTLACFVRLTPANRAAFLGYVGGRV